MQETWDSGLILGLGRSPLRGHSNPLHYSCMESPMDRRAWQATVHSVAKSQTRLRWLSTHACVYIWSVYVFAWRKSEKIRCNKVKLTPSFGQGRWGPLYIISCTFVWVSLVSQVVKNLPAMQETWVQSLGWEDPLGRAWQATPVFFPGESLWTEEPGELQSVGLQRAAHDWVTKHAHTFVYCTSEPYQCFI